MQAYKCDRCLQFFDLTEEDIDKDGDHKTTIFTIENDQWALMVAVAKVLPPPSEEAPPEARKDKHHISGIEMSDIQEMAPGLHMLMGAIRGHTHKGDEPQRVRADLCPECKKAVSKELLEKFINEEVTT